MKEKILAAYQKYKPVISKAQDVINLLLLIGAIMGLSIIIYSNITHKSEIEAVTKDEVYAQNKEEKEKQFVDISGQVVNPGVYEIERGDVLMDVVNRAGGLTDEADLFYIQKCINLAEKMKDEQKIYLPANLEKNNCNDNVLMQKDSSSLSAGIVSLNNATLDQLDTLPGIGPATAQKIIDARPFANIEDIKNVDGIGDSTFEKLKDSIDL